MYETQAKDGDSVALVHLQLSEIYFNTFISINLFLRNYLFLFHLFYFRFLMLCRHA